MKETINYRGVELEVEFDYTAHDWGDRENPPTPEEAIISGLKINGADVMELLENELDAIETEILDYLKKNS